MSGIGWAIGAAVTLLAVAAVSSSSSGQTNVAERGDTSDKRFTIKRDVIDASLALPLATFQSGDVLSVTLHDAKTGVDLPFLVTVDKVAKDGIDAVYNGMKTVTDLAPGTHFVVYPRDVLVRVPSVGGGDTAPETRILDASDVAMGPAAFAALTGFTDVTDFLLFNKGAFSDDAALVTDAGQPGIYVAGAVPFLTYRRVSPWTVGTKALVKKQPTATALPLPGILLAPGVAGEFGRSNYGSQFGARAARPWGV